MADVAPALPSIFWGTNNNVNPQVRAQIALAMLKSGKQPYPKTIGEGLSAIGNSLGDIGMARRLEQADIESQAKAAAGPDVSENETPADTTKTADASETPVTPAAEAPATTSTPPATVGPSVAEATAANSLVNPQRNAIATGLMRQQAAGGPQANPTDAGDQLQLASLAPSTSTPPSTPTVLSDVPKAPDIPLSPGTQLAQAAPPTATPPAATPAPAGVPPAYVMKEPVAPADPSVVPTPLEQKYIDWKLRNPGNIYVEQRANAVIEQEKAKRALLQEKWKTDYANYEIMRKLYEEQKASGVQRGLTEEETRQRVQQGNLPKIVTVNGQTLIQDPNTGELRPPTIVGQDPNGPPQMPLSQEQQRALLFHDWAGNANDLLKNPETERLLAHGMYQEHIGKVPIFGNSLQSAEYRRAKNAADNFILAFMRSTSGAMYGEKERMDHAKAMLPAYGDDAKTLADKAAARQAFVNAEYAGLGPARPYAEWTKAQRVKEDAARQTTIDNEMAGVPKVIGVEKKNNKTGARRVWNGEHWLEM